MIFFAWLSIVHLVLDLGAEASTCNLIVATNLDSINFRRVWAELIESHKNKPPFFHMLDYFSCYNDSARIHTAIKSILSRGYSTIETINNLYDVACNDRTKQRPKLGAKPKPCGYVILTSFHYKLESTFDKITDMLLKSRSLCVMERVVPKSYAHIKR